jgi:hypothetical protein
VAISRIRPVITERVASVNLPQYLSTALSVMTGLIQDIADFLRTESQATPVMKKRINTQTNKQTSNQSNRASARTTILPPTHGVGFVRRSIIIIDIKSLTLIF